MICSDSPREEVRGVVDLLDDLRGDGVLESMTIVLPEGVLSPPCRDYLIQTIGSSSVRGRGRVLSMLEFMALPEYRGVMTDDRLKAWWERCGLPHYEMSVQEVELRIRWIRWRRGADMSRYPTGFGSFGAAPGFAALRC